jgi:hypothetical protein
MAVGRRCALRKVYPNSGLINRALLPFLHLAMSDTQAQSSCPPPAIHTLGSKC